MIAVEAVDIVDPNFDNLSMRSYDLIHYQLLKETFRSGALLGFHSGSSLGHPRLSRSSCSDLRALALDDVQHQKMLH